MKQFYLNITVLFFLFSSTQIFNAQGIIQDDFLVNNDSIDIYNHHQSIAMNNSGNFIIAWDDHRNG